MNRRMTRLIRLVWVAGLTLGASVGWSQTLNKHNWYFGNSTNGITFNRVTNTATQVSNKAVPFGTGGSSVATDAGTANLLFYTDGVRVFDVTHTAMPNGSGLTANSAGNQPTAICAVPGRPGKYFIFTNTASFPTGGSISYSVVDMALFGNAAFPSPAFGDLESKNTAVPGLTGRAEGMIVVPHQNKTDFWLITQPLNSQTISATLINAASYAGTFTTITSTPAALPTSVAHFGYHSGLRKIAIAPQDVSTDAIIVNFNDASGVMTFDRTILNSGVTATNNQSIYDIEWSNSGRFLYLSRFGDTGITSNVFQYDYANTNTTLAPITTTPMFRSYGLQMAPDSAIYHLYQAASGGPFLVGRIDTPDTVATALRYTPNPFASANYNATQFPSFLAHDTVVVSLSFTTAGTCQNSPTTFFPNVKPAADSLFWDFGDTSGDRGISPVHTYQTAGTFNVVLNAFYRGKLHTTTQPVTITTFPLQIQMTSDTTACRAEFPPPRGSATPASQFRVKVNVQGGTPASIVWSNGDLGDTLTPDSAGYYYVVVTDAGGCSAYAGVNVREYGLQDQTFNKWYFGDKAGIDFNQQPPVALSESAMNAPEGCSIVCDRNGETIFYTDGQTVFDRTHTVIATNIGGSPGATQSALIVPVPDDETLYYIFTTQAINGTDSLILKYSLFDLKQNSGKGAVVKQDIGIFAKSTERIASNGRWLIVHEYGNSTFRSYPISSTGLGDPVFTSIGSIHSLQFQTNGEGYMKLGPRNNLAVPLSNPGVSNHIELFHLNDTTGRLTQFRDINLNEPNGQIYGVEFSPAGNKLFATVKVGSGSSHLFEYSIDSLEQPHFKQKLSPAAELGAIQVGPDGQVYVAVNNASNNTSLGLIAANEDTTQISSFTLNGFQLRAGTVSRLGLPSFVQQNSNALGGPNIEVTGLCLGDSTRFSGASRDQIDEFNWSVFQGATLITQSTEASFAFLFTAPGSYRVSLRLHNRCAPDTTMQQNFTINTRPAIPGGSAVLCTGPVTLDANPSNAAGITYAWSTGETTRTIVVSDQRIVDVVIADTNGCTSNGQFLVAENRPIVDLGPDLTVCEDNNTPALNAQNPGATYQWTVNGANTSTAQVLAVDTTTPGVFTYAVRITDPVTTCSVTETKTYTVNVSPAFTFTGVDPTSCGTPTGSVTLQLNASTPAGGPLYQYFISGGTVSQTGIDVTAPTTVTIPNVGAATYSAIVTDQISGCTLSSAIGLNDINLTIVPTVQGQNCDPVAYSIAVTGGASPYQFTVTNSGTGQTVIPTTTARPSPYVTSPALAAGSYVIQVSDAGGCVDTEPLTVTPNTPVPITVTPNLCNLTITASGATSYTWTSVPASAIASGASLATVSLTPNAGQVTYTVTATQAGQCPNTQSISLNVGNLTTPSLAQSNACSTTVQLTATPNGNFTYRWTRNGALDINLAGNQQTLTTAQNGSTYSVAIFDPQSGCTTLPSNTITAQVIGIVDAGLTSTPPCEDGQPITLTATTTNTSGATYAWTRDGSALTGVTTATTSQTDEGTYRVTVTRGPCSASASLLISRAPLPIGVLPNRVVICNDPDNADPATSSVDLDPGVFNQYVWSKNELPLNYTQQVYTADSEGLYEVLLTNEFSCVATDETEVLNECLPIVNAPNAFRPTSAQPANKVFKVFSFFITDENFNVYIFNRWGELVFSTNDRDFTWNGGYNNNAGQPLPPGTYSYVIQYVSVFRPDKGVQEKRGGVALLR